MPNLRTSCPYCKTDVLNRDIGSHILKNHVTQLFTDKTNLRALHSDANFRRPLALLIKDQPYYFCLADKSCIRRETQADNHFKGRADGHREAILKLREQIPVTGIPADDQTVPSLPIPQSSIDSQSPLTDKDKDVLQDFIMECFASSDVVLGLKVRQALKKLGLKSEKQDLQKLYPEHTYFQPEEREEEEEQPESEEQKEDIVESPEDQEEEEAAPLALPKPLTREEVFKQLMTPKDIKALTTSIVSGKTIEVPELQQFQKQTAIKRPTEMELFSANRVQSQPQQQVPLKIVQVTKRMAKQAN